MSQLSLAFDHVPRFGAEDFLRSPANQAAFDTIEAWPAWPDRVLLLIGPEGSGKTHLAHLWAARAAAAVIRPADFDRDLADLARHNGVVEDADREALPEAGLFHLLNLVREAGVFLLITARRPPGQWSLATPDLLSRLRLAPSVVIEPPDEGLMRAVLVKLFADRQLLVDANLIDYLALRLERSTAAARRAVDDLDRAGLDAGRRITRALAAPLFGDPLDDE